MPVTSNAGQVTLTSLHTCGKGAAAHQPLVIP